MRELSLGCRMRRRVAPEAPYHETHGNDAADADEQVSLHFALRLPRRCRKNVTSVGSWLLFHGGDNLEEEASLRRPYTATNEKTRKPARITIQAVSAVIATW